MTYTIVLLPHLGSFASNKDVATTLRRAQILPHLKNNEEVILDFAGIEGSTQSLIHALMAQPLQLYGRDILKLLKFKSANLLLRNLIGLVIDYSLLPPKKKLEDAGASVELK